MRKLLKISWEQERSPSETCAALRSFLPSFFHLSIHPFIVSPSVFPQSQTEATQAQACPRSFPPRLQSPRWSPCMLAPSPLLIRWLHAASCFLPSPVYQAQIQCCSGWYYWSWLNTGFLTDRGVAERLASGILLVFITSSSHVNMCQGCLSSTKCNYVTATDLWEFLS